MWMDSVKAPWTAEQVSALNRFQLAEVMHPFTCPNGHGSLLATVESWVCRGCDYTQDWAHEVMFDVTWLESEMARRRTWFRGPA